MEEQLLVNIISKSKIPVIFFICQIELAAQDKLLSKEQAAKIEIVYGNFNFTDLSVYLGIVFPVNSDNALPGKVIMKRPKQAGYSTGLIQNRMSAISFFVSPTTPLR